MRIVMYKQLWIYIAMWIVCAQLAAQDILDAPIEDKLGKRIFRAAPVVGFNATQVDGDSLAGFHKLGLVFGAYGQIKIKPLFAIGIEVLYSQKGSRANKPFLNRNGGIISEYKLEFGYAEVPITLRYTDKYVHFYAGASFGQILNYKEIENGVTLSQNDSVSFYKKRDFNYIGGIVFFPYKGIGVDIRFQKSFVNIVSNPSNGRQVHRLISMRIMYLF